MYGNGALFWTRDGPCQARSKDANINLRLPEAMLNALRDGASKKKIPTQRYIRMMLEKGLMAEWTVGGVVVKSRRKAAVKPASTRRNVA